VCEQVGANIPETEKIKLHANDWLNSKRTSKGNGTRSNIMLSEKNAWTGKKGPACFGEVGRPNALTAGTG